MTQITGKGQSGGQHHKLEVIWDDLLSGQPERVRAAYVSLTEPEQKVVYKHLQRMADEPGWQPEQQLSARTALRAIEDQS